MTRQRKLLTIDGGGIRGVLSLEILDEFERQLAEAQGIPREHFTLSDFFDYVGGTSTGCVVAACIARGMSVAEIKKFYHDLGPSMFDNRLYKKALTFFKDQSAYDATPLAKALQTALGEKTTLEPGNLKTLLLAVTRNQTTASPWPISSNPAAKYNAANREDCNLRIPLWKIVRASTAAPLAFRPEKVSWDPSDPSKTFIFVDGGVTPYNNPAFLIYRMATEAKYNLGWEAGEDKMMVVSVGTGSSSKGDDDVLGKTTGFARFLGNRKIPGALIQGTMVDQDVNCRTVGRCVYGQPIDREVGDLIPRDAEGNPIPLSQDLGRKFLYARYNAHLEQDDLDAMGLSDVKAERVKKMSSVEFIDDLAKVGRRVAQDVNVQDFAPFLHRVEVS